jgi:1-acyl-sn-glycerol-3-phosphate acyltransferase
MKLCQVNHLCNRIRKRACPVSSSDHKVGSLPYISFKKASTTSIKGVSKLFLYGKKLASGLGAVSEGFYLVYRHGLYKDINNPQNTRYVQYFCRRLCKVFNIDVHVHGDIPRKPALWVSNHISWLDVAVLGSGARVFFLAKAEIEKWPVFGKLAKSGGTLFIQRGSGDSIKIREQITAFLKQDIPVLFFPEATTTDGSKVKKVHGRILGAAIEAQRDVQICLICYVNQQGGLDQVSPFIGNISFAADQLFATLDPTLRRLEWDGIGPLVLADTVGFVRNLAHALVESFKATLEETLEASLLLHVIDSSSPDHMEQIEAVEKVLKEIGADIPILRVYNKIDQSGEQAKIIYAKPNVPERVYVSAHTGEGFDLLRQAVQECLMGQIQNFDVLLKPAYGKLRNQLYALNVIQSENYDDEGNLHLQVYIAPHKLEQLIKQAHLPIDEILGLKAKQFHRELEEFEIKN